MLKKLFILCLVCCCFSPAYAQRGGGRGVHHGKKPAAHHYTLKKKVRRTTTRAAMRPTVPKETHIQIMNMPGEPLVKLSKSVDHALDISPARMLPGADSYYMIHPADPTGRYTGDYFIPQDMLGNEKAFYRGMRIGKIEDLKNLLINGLETHRTYYHGEIYASLMPSLTLFYATMGMEPNLQVLIKIPATETLRSYAPEAFPTEDRYAPRAFQTGEQAVFRRDVPAEFISDVWVFLEVDGKPDWYKVILENDELVFIPAFGKMIKL